MWGFLYNKSMNKRVCFELLAVILALCVNVASCAATDGSSYNYSIEVDPSTGSMTINDDESDNTKKYESSKPKVYEYEASDDADSDSEELSPAILLALLPMLFVPLLQPIVIIAIIVAVIKSSKKNMQNNAIAIRRNYRNATNNPLDGYIVPNAAPKTTGFNYDRQNDVSPIQSSAPVGTAPTILGDAAKPQTKIELDEYGRPKPII